MQILAGFHKKKYGKSISKTLLLLFSRVSSKKVKKIISVHGKKNSGVTNAQASTWLLLNED